MQRIADGDAEMVAEIADEPDSGTDSTNADDTDAAGTDDDTNA